jgi:hypothetical protein
MGDIIWRPRNRPLLAAWDMGRDKRDKVACGWECWTTYVCTYSMSVRAGGERTGMTVPYYSGVIRTALRTGSLPFDSTSRLARPALNEKIILVTLHSGCRLPY